MICLPGLQIRISITSTGNLKRHTDLKHPASLLSCVQLTKNKRESQNRSFSMRHALTNFNSGSVVISQPQMEGRQLFYFFKSQPGTYSTLYLFAHSGSQFGFCFNSLKKRNSSNDFLSLLFFCFVFFSLLCLFFRVMAATGQLCGLNK